MIRNWLACSLVFLAVPLLAGQWAPAPPNSQQPYPDSQQPQQPSYQQNSSTNDDQPDPADLQHGVARLSVVQGDVNVRRGDNGQVTGAVINAPVLTRDHLEISEGSRAEVQVDAANIIRLGPNSEVGFADLQYGRARLELGLGTVIFRVLQNSSSQIEIDTPSVGISALMPGEYRISVFDNGTSEVTVRSGQLQISGPHGSERLDPGRTFLVRGDASDPEMQTVSEVSRDQFDQWSEDRDREFAGTQSYQYVNADMQGAADLDQYGSWVPSGYGQVWRPQGVASDWSPYSNGQWSYVDYYGWSWIDYSPWGWAPYHYGRWFWNTGAGWCWWPGARYQRSYWSPALVGFFGFGGRVGIGFGGLGWIALAPHERFNRWWGRGGSYSGFNGYRGGYGLNSYRNAAIRGGAMTSGYNSFGGPHQRFSAATRSQLVGGSVFAGHIPVVATQSSYHYSDRQTFQSNRLASVQSHNFYRQGASPQRQQSTGFNAQSSGSNRSNNSSVSGWQSHFGSPATTSRAGSLRQNSQTPEASGWHNFGGTRDNATPTSQQPRSYQQQQRPYQAPQNSFRPQTQYGQQPRSNYSQPAPRQNYSAPSQPHYNNSQPHYSAPSAPRGGGGSGGGSRGGGGHHGR